MGCSPDYNWREVSVADGVAKAIFPDKPASSERTLDFAGQKIVFTLTSAKAKGASFTVGHALFPPALRDNETARNEFGQGIMKSLYRNLGAETPQVMPPFGTDFVIEGRSFDGPLTLRAKIWLSPYALVEGIVTAPGASFPEQQATDFLNGLEVAR